MQQSFLSAGLILAWLVTPESLKLVSSSSGMSGLLVIISLGFGAILALTSAYQLHNPQLVRAGYTGDFKILSDTYGKALGLSVLFSGRIPLLLFASTGMLVSAGFAFNEIFLYWFPNFLFAFILLAVIAALNAFAGSFANISQLLFVSLTILGLIILIVLGAISDSAVSGHYAGQQKGLSASLLAIGCLSFLGFDFHRSEKGRIVLVPVLLGGFMLLVFWAGTALKFIEPSRLAETTIAHIIVARAIAGETGRFIMGTVIICGVLSGVNGLFIVARRAFTDLDREGFISKRINRNWLVTTALSAIIGVMMITGFAGEQVLETRIKASIVLWLIYLSLRNFAVSHVLRRSTGTGNFLGYLTGFTYLAVGAVLIVTSSQMGYIFWFITAVFTGTLVLSIIWTAIYNNRDARRLISRRM